MTSRLNPKTRNMSEEYLQLSQHPRSSAGGFPAVDCSLVLVLAVTIGLGLLKADLSVTDAMSSSSLG